MYRPLGLSLVLSTASLAVAETKPVDVDFSRDIRPILSDRCFKCHGFDDQTREADLGLHTFEEATRDLGGYRAIVPGDPGASEILFRMTSDDPAEVMPPPEANKPRLSQEELVTLRAWIEAGAEFEKHWAFVPPRKPPVPDAGAGVHPIDAFVGRGLASKGLSPNPEADPYTLIRRLSLDLRGFPPTVEETDAYLDAHAVNPGRAWADLIDAFLASTAYGEKWAREWLDLARYADTNGYEKDRDRSIWPYRDWVIDALNRNLPYDRFSIEQLAGDMLPDATLDQIVATGFHRNTMLNEEGGIDPLEFRYHAMVDRVATTGTVWMGLTTGCAQCHTHKYDPITHTDYFALMGLLNNAEEPEIEIPDPGVTARREEIQRQIDAKIDAAVKTIDEGAYTSWLNSLERRSADWFVLDPLSVECDNLKLEIIEEDRSIYASGDFTKRDVYRLRYRVEAPDGKPVTALRLEAIPDDRLPAHGPGAAYYEGRKGDFFLSELKAAADGRPVEFSGGSVNFGKIAIGSGDATAANVFDGDGSTGWSTATREGERHELVLELETPVKAGELEVEMLFERHFVAALGRFRISATTDTGEVVAREPAIPDPATASDAALRRAYVRFGEEHAEVRKQIVALEKRKPTYPTTLVMRERPADNPRKTHLHHRGEYLSPREEVAPAVPALFEPIPDGEPKNRLGLARWLVSERNPLGARVAVNRAWRSFFGRGLVDTEGDFGLQSPLPSHPGLLDWLAVTFVETGWSTKYLYRLIVTSETYRRDSAVTSALTEADPDNVWLARGPRVRLSGEAIRDSALQASGLLTREVGGPSVYPPQPASVTDMAYGAFRWKTSGGADRYRRSLYTFAKRTAPFAAYLAFDGPTGEFCLPRRDVSNTPLQALTLLNDEMYGEMASALAGGVLAERGGEGPRAVALELFRRVLTRHPDGSEVTDLVHFYQQQRARFAKGELDAAAFAADDAASADHAAWTMVARALLNTSEAITKG